jgi:hypothetical protein
MMIIFEKELLITACHTFATESRTASQKIPETFDFSPVFTHDSDHLQVGHSSLMIELQESSMKDVVRSSNDATLIGNLKHSSS